MKTKDKYINIPDFLIILKSMREGTHTISDIHRDLKITLAHLYNTKKVLLAKNLITMENIETHKRKIPTLTDKGKELVSATDKILKVLGIKDSEIKENLFRSKWKEGEKMITKKDKEELDQLVDVVEEGFN